MAFSAEESRIRRWLSNARRSGLKGRRFWRCIEKEYEGTVLDAGPSFAQTFRYNAGGEFSALYLSESRTLARLEKTRGKDFHADLMEAEFRFAADEGVPDLTDPGTEASLRDDLGVEPAELRVAGTAGYARTLPFARAAFHAGLPGLLVPSAHPARADAAWRNLVLYPAHILRRWLVRC